MHKVLKSKIEDFSGMTAVNLESETTDLEVFAKHIHTDSLKQVWRGKPKHKPDMADALANGDWLTGGKELGKSLVRGLAKTVRRQSIGIFIHVQVTRVWKLIECPALMV